MRMLTGATLVVAAIFSCSCTPDVGGNDYNTAAVGEISTTSRGRVAGVRSVMLHAKDRSELGAGAVIGGITGALLGSTAGKGSGKTVTAVVGGLAGGAAGHLLEGKISDQPGFEYQVELDNGEIITLAQGQEPHLSVGQRVLVIRSNQGPSRIVPDQT